MRTCSSLAKQSAAVSTCTASSACLSVCLEFGSMSSLKILIFEKHGGNLLSYWLLTKFGWNSLQKSLKNRMVIWACSLWNLKVSFCTLHCLERKCIFIWQTKSGSDQIPLVYHDIPPSLPHVTYPKLLTNFSDLFLVVIIFFQNAFSEKGV